MTKLTRGLILQICRVLRLRAIRNQTKNLLISLAAHAIRKAGWVGFLPNPDGSQKDGRTANLGSNEMEVSDPFLLLEAGEICYLSFTDSFINPTFCFSRFLILKLLLLSGPKLLGNATSCRQWLQRRPSSKRKRELPPELPPSSSGSKSPGLVVDPFSTH
jgi:hypothetical protein